MSDTQPDTHCTHSTVLYVEDPPGSEFFRIDGVKCMFTVRRKRRRWNITSAPPPVKDCAHCEKFEPRGKYDLDACKRLMAKVLRPWLPHAEHFIYDYLGIKREDVVRRRMR